MPKQTKSSARTRPIRTNTKRGRKPDIEFLGITKLSEETRKALKLHITRRVTEPPQETLPTTMPPRTDGPPPLIHFGEEWEKNQQSNRPALRMASEERRGQARAYIDQLSRFTRVSTTRGSGDNGGPAQFPDEPRRHGKSGAKPGSHGKPGPTK